MPRIIRQALYEKLQNLPEINGLREDFRVVSGLDLGLVDELGRGCPFEPGEGTMCAVLREGSAGRGMCARFRQAMLVKAGAAPVAVGCDAGLREAAVPVVVGGITAGYLLMGGVSTAAADGASAARAAHLLGRAGVRMTPDECRVALERSPVMDEARFVAWLRMLGLAARQIASRMTQQITSGERPLPAAVARACRMVEQRALVEDMGLAGVADHCGVSAGHLSRLFHQATGLTFREYLARFRAEHARGLLLSTQKSVTEIAFASGFQSISQFHRVFRRVHGAAPGAVRADQQRTSKRTAG